MPQSKSKSKKSPTSRGKSGPKSKSATFLPKSNVPASRQRASTSRSGVATLAQQNRERKSRPSASSPSGAKHTRSTSRSTSRERSMSRRGNIARQNSGNLRAAVKMSKAQEKEAEEQFGVGGLNTAVDSDWGLDAHVSKTAAPTKRKQRVNFLNQFETKELKAPHHSLMDKIWGYYDADGGGTLDAHEINIMAVECVERTIKMLADNILDDKPNISKRTLQKMVDQEKYFYLPGENTSDQETVADMVKMLGSHLDVDHSGDITKPKFLARFPGFAKSLWSAKETEKEGDICVIL